MNITLKELKLPNFGIPEETPIIPNEIFEERCRKAYQLAKCDWLLVYGDREHAANLYYLSGFDPRFEEGLLLLGPGGERYLLVGNEGVDYAGLATIKLEIVLYQSFGLLGQDRSITPRLDQLMLDLGLKKGDRVGIVGWKYADDNERIPGLTNIFAPSLIVECVARITDTPVADATSVLMHPTEGLRAINEIEQIVAFEWGAARASAAVQRIVNGVRIGMTEHEAVGNMRYMGEPMTCHPMFSVGKEKIVGLRSPTSRRIAKGDGVTTAVGYWGGLSCRAGLIDDANVEFLNKHAIPYFRTIALWYSEASIGKTGGELFDAVTAELGKAGLKSALNPGHLTSIDEWMHSPIRPGSRDTITSGMAMQCDIIPTPMPDGTALNCEDSVVFADESLRNELKQKYPQVWERIKARQDFVRNEIGIAIHDDLLPLSTNAAYFSPFWLAPNKVLVVG